MSIVAKRLDISRCHLVGGRPRPRDIVLDEDPAPLPQKMAQQPLLTFRPTYVVAKRLDGSSCLLVRPHCVRRGHSSHPHERGTAAPTFRPMSFVAKQSPISATAELLLNVGNVGQKYDFH